MAAAFLSFSLLELDDAKLPTPIFLGLLSLALSTDLVVRRSLLLGDPAALSRLELRDVSFLRSNVIDLEDFMLLRDTTLLPLGLPPSTLDERALFRDNELFRWGLPLVKLDSSIL